MINQNFRWIYKALLALSLAAALTSCEDIIYGEGKIFDAQTLEPLDSVLCQNSRNEVFSDSSGFYDLSFGLVSCTFGCPDVEFTYSKNGYQTLVIDNPAKQDIFLWKE